MLFTTQKSETSQKENGNQESTTETANIVTVTMTAFGDITAIADVFASYIHKNHEDIIGKNLSDFTSFEENQLTELLVRVVKGEVITSNLAILVDGSKRYNNGIFTPYGEGNEIVVHLFLDI